MSRAALRLLLILAAGLALIAIPAIGGTAQDSTPAASPEASPAASPAASAGEEQVTIKDFVFTPQKLEVPVGTTVTWTNQDVTQHTVVSEGNWKSDILQKGDTFSYTFDKAGTFDYICTLHPNMKGQVIVTGS